VVFSAGDASGDESWITRGPARHLVDGQRIAADSQDRLPDFSRTGPQRRQGRSPE
jgi:hypothetical protein